MSSSIVIPSAVHERVARWGATAAWSACVLNGVWLASIIALVQHGDTAAQVRDLAWLFQLSVGAALLLTLCNIVVLVGAGVVAAHRDPVPGLVGTVVSLLYVPINLGAYFLFGAMSPVLWGAPEAGAVSTQTLAAAIEIGNPHALFGNLPLLGYAVLCTGWLFLIRALWGRDRLWTATCVVMLLSAVPAIAGGLGAYLGNEILATGCFIGGIFSWPAVGLLAAALGREARGARTAFAVNTAVADPAGP